MEWFQDTEAHAYFAGNLPDAKLMDEMSTKVKRTMSGLQDSKLYKQFIIQLSNTGCMDEKKEYNAQLDLIDKEHKFIILRSLNVCAYEVEMHRSQLSRRLFIIYESLCHTTGKKGHPTIPRKKAQCLS